MWRWIKERHGVVEGIQVLETDPASMCAHMEDSFVGSSKCIVWNVLWDWERVNSRGSSVERKWVETIHTAGKCEVLLLEDV